VDRVKLTTYGEEAEVRRRQVIRDGMGQGQLSARRT
jgi:urease alpha subunit